MSASARRAILDAALERTVIASCTNIGYAVHSRRWKTHELARMDGKVVVVTGASAGLGAAAAAGFARLGATVWLVSRSRERGELARARIAAQTGSATLRTGVCDPADLRSVRRFADALAAESSRVDVLVNNAGVLTRERSRSPDGVELTLATNVVGPFLLTELLTPLLRAGAPARVINVSSAGMYMRRLHVEDLQSARGRFRGARAYAHSKRVQVILSELWARRLRAGGVSVHAMHPGWVDTPGLRESLPRFHALMRGLLRTPEQGADTIVWLGSSPRALQRSGAFWLDRAPRPTHVLPWTRETQAERERLWDEIERLSGVPAAP
jgi:dehydrogenase/reductase SDR family member 12